MRSLSELPPIRPLLHREPFAVMRIAHRGAGGQERYHLTDLHEVAAQGGQFVEVDLHVTGDHQLVARHNPLLETDEGHFWLFDHPLTTTEPALRNLGAPTADDAIKYAKEANLGLYLDIKSVTEPAVERLAEILEMHGMASSTILASVRSDIVEMCAEIAPRIPRSVLFSSILEDPVQLALAINANFVHPCWERQHTKPNLLLEGHWLNRVRSHGLGVITWHEERPQVLRSLLELGVDGICTDTPDLLTRLALEGRPSDRGARGTGTPGSCGVSAELM